MLTSELLDTHRDALKEKEGTIVELLWRVEKLDAEGKEATTKITRFQADLDHEVVVQQGGRWSWSDFGESRRRGRLCESSYPKLGES